MKQSWRLFLIIGLAALYIIAQPAPPPPFPYPQPIGDMPPSAANLPGDCAIVATEAYARVAKTATWARLLHLDLKKEGGHIVCAWQVAAHDPILVYDKFLLGGSTMELHTSQRDAKVIAGKLRDALSHWEHGKVTITAAHFVQ